MPKPDVPAFAHGNPEQGGDPGMTLRQWYAGLAMQALCAGTSRVGADGSHVSEWVPGDAFAIADAMIAEAEREE